MSAAPKVKREARVAARLSAPDAQASPLALRVQGGRE